MNNFGNSRTLLRLLWRTGNSLALVSSKSVDIFGTSDIVASFKDSRQLSSTGLEGVKSGTGKEGGGGGG